MSDEESLLDQIIDEGDVAFSHDWDSGGPGPGAGSERVYHQAGRFAVASPDFGNAGPFATLDEALRERDLLTVNSATTRIECSMLSTTELARRLSCDEDGLEILINGGVWVYSANAGAFTPVG